MTLEPTELLAATSCTGSGDMASLVRESAGAIVSAAEPFTVGDHTVAVRHPRDWTVTFVDARHHEDHPREREGRFTFTSPRSLARYVNRFATPATLGYIAALTENTLTALTQPHPNALYVLDDFPSAAPKPEPATPEVVGNRCHIAILQLCPTAAARRWATALAAPIGQQQFVDLIDDGTAEIAEPPAAALRDLISDLHAIRTTSAKTVIRTGGGTAVEVAENAQLHAGPGSIVEVPAGLKIVFAPWLGLGDLKIVLDVKIRPSIGQGGEVRFTLAAPDLEDRLAEVVASIEADLTAETDISPFHAVI